MLALLPLIFAIFLMVALHRFIEANPPKIATFSPDYKTHLYVLVVMMSLALLMNSFVFGTAYFSAV